MVITIRARSAASAAEAATADRKSTRLNSSHDQISYAVFCLKKKKNALSRAYTPLYTILSVCSQCYQSTCSFFFFFLMIRRPPRSTLFSLHDALPISARRSSPAFSTRTPRQRLDRLIVGQHGDHDPSALRRFRR